MSIASSSLFCDSATSENKFIEVAQFSPRQSITRFVHGNLKNSESLMTLLANPDYLYHSFQELFEDHDEKAY